MIPYLFISYVLFVFMIVLTFIIFVFIGINFVNKKLFTDVDTQMGVFTMISLHYVLSIYFEFMWGLYDHF